MKGHDDTFTSRLSREVHDRLRSAIVRGEIRPNERLIEAELAERLNVSRTPIREALQRLAVDGLIVNRRRGWQVRDHSRVEIREIYEVRAALEAYAARLAATRADDCQLAVIEELSGGDSGELVAPPRAALVDHNDAFHDAVIIAADNRRLAEQIRRNREFFFNYQLAAAYTREEAAAALRGHSAIAQALRDRDPRRAEDATRRHISEALTLALEKLA